jgi:peptide-methionine (S)-S-oxide reductase
MRALVFAIAAALLPAASQAEDLQHAVLAGGCFWCVESDFDHLPGVVETTSGYTGGTLDNPSYEQVSHTETGHYEAVRITFDADRLSYGDLLSYYWRTVDPTDPGGQFCDRGDSYRTAVFAKGPEQKAVAEKTRAEAEAALGQKIVTPILDAGIFWPAEEYHQEYYEKNSLRYAFYRRICGRDARVRDVWGDAAQPQS